MLPGNGATVRLFRAMQTQWRIGMGGATGLDYNVVPLVAEKIGVALTKTRFWGLQVMEMATLDALNKDG